MFDAPRPDTDEIRTLLAAFINFVTTEQFRHNKLKCIEWLQSTFLSDFPCHAVRSEIGGCPYLLCRRPDERLLWFGHTDVVPGNPGQFTLRVEGDTAFGRGVKDMKGACLPFLMAYRDARNQGEDPPVSILLTSDEETAGHSVPILINELGLRPPVAFTPDTGSSPGIVIEHKAVLWAELSASSASVHAAMPWLGGNAVGDISEALVILKKHYPTGNADDWGMTVTPTVLRGGETKNQTPQKVTCTLDVRFPQELFSSHEEALESIRRRLPPSVSLRIITSAPSLAADRNHPMIALVRRIAEEIEGRKIPFIREHGSTDARYFHQAGIPAFLYGPEGGNLHGPEEWVSLSSLDRQYRMYRQLFRELKA